MRILTEDLTTNVTENTHKIDMHIKLFSKVYRYRQTIGVGDLAHWGFTRLQWSFMVKDSLLENIKNHFHP